MKKLILGLTVLSMGLAACDDFLTEEPELMQSNELTFSDFESLNSAAAGVYAMLQSDAWYGADYVLYSELRAGNAKNPVSFSGSGRYRIADYGTWNETESHTSALWSYAYYTIAWANNVINNLEGKESPDVTAKMINNVKAECLFMRAFCYFNLVTTYAQPYTYAPESLGVPVVLVTENGKPARDDVKTVWGQIETDLLEAEKLMSDDYAREGVNDVSATVTKPAIQAMLSRIYLYMGKWQESANYATTVINSGKYNLLSGDKYKEMFTASAAPKGSEIIFEMFGSNKNAYWDDSGWPHIPYITTRPDKSEGSGDVSATKDLIDMYEAGDVRGEMFENVQGDWFCLKYAGKTGSSVPKENNVPIIRLAEVYLNRAEALFNGATISGATAAGDLATLAAKRGATPASPSKTSIFNERRKELAFEGHIFYDYARCQMSMTRTDYAGLTNKDMPFPDKRWAFPIPKREMDANPNMEQNPY